MADPVKGTLEIQSDPGAATRILLDPGKADITAGGNGTAGDLILKGADNSELVRLGQITESIVAPNSTAPTIIASYTGLRIRTPAGVNLVQIGRKGVSSSPLQPVDEIEAIVGGNGFSGTLRLVDKNGKTRFLLGEDQGHDGRLVVSSDTGKKILEFDPATATLYVGADGNSGDVIVRDSSGKERIKLAGGQGDISVRNAAGKELLLFDTTVAGLYVGGEGNEGDVVVRDAALKERIKLDGGEGDIWVKDAAGNQLLLFNSGNAALYVGGVGNEGDVVVRNAAGATSIHLDGAQGDIILSNGDCAEEFDTAHPASPGSVMVIGDDERLRVSTAAYDRRVAGVVSGAGSYRPGIVLDRRPDDPAPSRHCPGRKGLLPGRCELRADQGWRSACELLHARTRHGSDRSGTVARRGDRQGSQAVVRRPRIDPDPCDAAVASAGRRRPTGSARFAPASRRAAPGAVQLMSPPCPDRHREQDAAQWRRS